MKTCTLCKINKPLSEFWRDNSKKHGLSARCKTCKSAAYTVYRKTNGYDKTRYWKNPTAERERHLIRKYGVTLADYFELAKNQAKVPNHRDCGQFPFRHRICHFAQPFRRSDNLRDNLGNDGADGRGATFTERQVMTT